MAGIPPLAGFFGKYFLFLAAFEAENYLLVITGMMTSLISTFYYLRVIQILLFEHAGIRLVGNEIFSIFRLETKLNTTELTFFFALIAFLIVFLFFINFIFYLTRIIIFSC